MAHDRLPSQPPENRVWKTLRTEVAFEHAPYVRVERNAVLTDCGQSIDDYYRVKLSTFACCVPFDRDGRAVTLWQYKFGPERYTLTFPAGNVEPGEDPGNAAVRELLEETGYRAGRVIALGDFVDSGNQEGSTAHYFLALDCELVAEPNSDDLGAADLRLMTPDELDAALAAGDMVVSHSAIAWLLASRAR